MLFFFWDQCFHNKSALYMLIGHVKNIHSMVCRGVGKIDSHKNHVRIIIFCDLDGWIDFFFSGHTMGSVLSLLNMLWAALL